MFLKILFFILVLPSVLWANNLIVKSGMKKFTLEFDVNKIILTGSQVNLSLKKNDCNKNIIEKFNLQINKLIKTKTLSRSYLKNGFEFSYNGKKYYDRYKSKMGYYIIKIPSEVHRLKLEEKFKCKKNN